MSENLESLYSEARDANQRANAAVAALELALPNVEKLQANIVDLSTRRAGAQSTDAVALDVQISFAEAQLDTAQTALETAQTEAGAAMQRAQALAMEAELSFEAVGRAFNAANDINALVVEAQSLATLPPVQPVVSDLESSSQGSGLDSPPVDLERRNKRPQTLRSPVGEGGEMASTNMGTIPELEEVSNAVELAFQARVSAKAARDGAKDAEDAVARIQIANADEHARGLVRNAERLLEAWSEIGPASPPAGDAPREEMRPIPQEIPEPRNIHERVTDAHQRAEDATRAADEAWRKRDEVRDALIPLRMIRTRLESDSPDAARLDEEIDVKRLALGAALAAAKVADDEASAARLLHAELSREATHLPEVEPVPKPKKPKGIMKRLKKLFR